MVRMTYHTLSKWLWKKLQVGNQTKLLQPGCLPFLICNGEQKHQLIEILLFFFYKINIYSVSFIEIDSILDKNSKNSNF